MNWHEFFKRFTIVTSILTIPIVGIIGGIVYEVSSPYLFLAPAGVIGLPLAIGQWIVFFLIRWIVRGLKK